MAASIGEGDGAGGCTTGSGLTSGGLTGSGGVGSSTAAGGGATICGTSINSITTGFCGCMIGTTSKTTRAASIAAWTTPSTAIIGQLVRLSRSEEHTSELQSLMRISYAVFCLKKKNTQHQREDKHLTQPKTN